MNKKTLFGLILAFMLLFGLSTAVSAAGNLDIQQASLSLTGDPGTAVSSTLTVRNIGGSDFANVSTILMDDLTAGTEVIPTSAFSASPALTAVAASSSQDVAVSVTIPANQKAGTYSDTVRSYVNNTVYDTMFLAVVVNAVPGFSASAGSVEIAQGYSGTITVTVVNTGNTDLATVAYDVTDPFVRSGGVETLSVSGATTGGTGLIAYGNTKTFTITFNVPAGQTVGTYQGQVALAHGTDLINLDLSVVVRAPTTSISMPDVDFPESERETNVTQTLTITNTGDATLTGVTLTSSASDLTYSGVVPGTMSPGASFTVTLETEVPVEQDSGRDLVGTLTFSSAQLTETADVYTNAESMLEFDRVRVSIDDSSFDTVDDGDTADDDARPGSSFEMTVKMENLFDDDYNDGDMDDVQITAVFYGAGESGDDIDGETDTFSLDAGEKSDDEPIDFDDDIIDWESDTGKLLVELIAEGEDDNGAKHTARMNFTINVDRESKEFIFTRVDAPDTVSCGNTLTIYADGRSIGENSDDEVRLEIENSALDIQVREEFEMGAFDDDDSCDALDRDEEDCTDFSFRKSFPVPRDIASGSYTIVAKLWRDGGNEQTDEETIEVNVQCTSTSSTSSTTTSTTSGTTSSTSSGTAGTTGSTSSTTGSTSSGTIGTSSSTPSQGSSTTGSIDVFYGSNTPSSSSRGAVAHPATKITDTSSSGSFRGSTAYIALLAIGALLLVVIIVSLLVFALSSGKE